LRELSLLSDGSWSWGLDSLEPEQSLFTRELSWGLDLTGASGDGSWSWGVSIFTGAGAELLGNGKLFLATGS
jgi:hypothetical protein